MRLRNYTYVLSTYVLYEYMWYLVVFAANTRSLLSTGIRSVSHLICVSLFIGYNVKEYLRNGRMSTLVCDMGTSGVVRSRDGLRLALNRSLSEPGPPDVSNASSTGAPPKRCKLESVSLPPSPCSDSATLQKTLILKKVRQLDPEGFRQKLIACKESRGTVRPFLVIDCRSFIAYNINHIRGSINVNCSDRFNRRRLHQGKATLVDLTTTREGKDMLKKRCYREVIVYDEGTADLERLTTSHPLFLIFVSLIEDNKEPILLMGEFTLVFFSFLPIFQTA